MSIKRRLKRLEQKANVGQQDPTIIMIRSTGFPFKDDHEKCASYRKQIAELEKSYQMIPMVVIYCEECKEDCEHAK